jgi:hypothetical protein
LIELRITRDLTRKFYCSVICRSTYVGRQRDMTAMWAKGNLPEVNARKGRPGPTKANWRPVGATRLHSEGYVLEKQDDGEWAYQHRVVAKTDADQVTHHKNRIKTDNRPENLVALSNSEHAALHARKDRNAEHE